MNIDGVRVSNSYDTSKRSRRLQGACILINERLESILRLLELVSAMDRKQTLGATSGKGASGTLPWKTSEVEYPPTVWEQIGGSAAAMSA